MSLQCGIVGLPNVGKSTTFNALTKNFTAEVANYAFCTIDPNTAITNIPDDRLNTLAKIAQSKKIVPATVQFVDIAGLVAGASKGEGLGNQFLSHIREVNAILHLVRCFDDSNITHSSDKVNPIQDIEIINTELILSDIATVEKMILNLEKKNKNKKDDNLTEQIHLLKEVATVLNNGQPASTLNTQYQRELQLLPIITNKPVLYLANVNENDINTGNIYTKQLQAHYPNSLIISAKIESEISQIESLDEQKEFLKSLGLERSCLDQVIQQTHKMLNLQSFFTVGVNECRSWSFKTNMTAYDTAGIIHTDFQKKFIKAEVISYADYISYHGEIGARNNGKLRLEGKNYIMQDGDIVTFKFNI